MSDAGQFDGWTDWDLSAERDKLAGQLDAIQAKLRPERRAVFGLLNPVEMEIERRRVAAESEAAMVRQKADAGPAQTGPVILCFACGHLRQYHAADPGEAERCGGCAGFVETTDGSAYRQCGCMEFRTEDSIGRATWRRIGTGEHPPPDRPAWMAEGPMGPWWVWKDGRWSRHTERPSDHP